MTLLVVSDVLAAVDSFLAGHLETGDLEAWAERLEMAEDVEYAEAERGAMAEVIFWLANPAINGALTVERVREIRAWLLQDTSAP